MLRVIDTKSWWEDRQVSTQQGVWLLGLKGGRLTEEVVINGHPTPTG